MSETVPARGVPDWRPSISIVDHIVVVDNADGSLLAGGYADVKLLLPANANSVAIPASSLIFAREGLQVATLGADSKVLMKSIHIDRDMGKSVEVTGLQAHDRVIDNPPESLASGDLEIANLAYSTLPTAIHNAGLSDLRVISDEFQDGVPDYYSQEYMVLTDGPVKRLEDMKGRIIATNAAGGAVEPHRRVDVVMAVKHEVDAVSLQQRLQLW